MELNPAGQAVDVILRRGFAQVVVNVRRDQPALAAGLRDKLEGQKTIKALESERNRKRRELFEAQDAIDAQRDGLIGDIGKQLNQRRMVATLFTIRWTVV